MPFMNNTSMYRKSHIFICLFSVLSQFDGQRNKLVACDGNEIDTMFVDRRRDGGGNGQTLVNYSTGSFWRSCVTISHIALDALNVRILSQVICCEGNAGFYEVGCMNTPLEGEEFSSSESQTFLMVNIHPVNC